MTQATTVLVEFRRYKAEEVGEDDALVHPRILINPVFVSAVLEDVENPLRAVIRLPDGRGFAVRGSYQEVCARLGVTIQEAESTEPLDNVSGEDLPN